jgi:hypothetical protein
MEAVCGRVIFSHKVSFYADTYFSDIRMLSGFRNFQLSLNEVISDLSGFPEHEQRIAAIIEISKDSFIFIRVFIYGNFYNCNFIVGKE